MSPSSDRIERIPTAGISDSMEHSSIVIPVTETVTPYLVEQPVSSDTETVKEPEAEITILIPAASSVSTENISQHLDAMTASNDATESTDHIPTSSVANPKMPPSLEGK